MKKFGTILLSVALAAVVLFAGAGCGKAAENAGNGSSGGEQPKPAENEKLTEAQFRAAIKATLEAPNLTEKMTSSIVSQNGETSKMVLTYYCDLDNHKMYYRDTIPSGEETVYYFVKDNEIQCWDHYGDQWEKCDLGELSEATPENIEIVFFEQNVPRYGVAGLKLEDRYNEFVYDKEADVYTVDIGVVDEVKVGKVMIAFQDGKLVSLVNDELDEDGDPTGSRSTIVFSNFGSTVVTIPTIPQS